MIKITDAELRKAFLDASRHKDGLFTSAELARKMNMARNSAVKWIRQGIDAGLLQYVGNEQRESIDGRLQWVPAYKLTKKKAGSIKDRQTLRVFQ